MTEEKYFPTDFVVPIVALNDDGSCGQFLGSGVLVGEQPILVTCDHVLALWDGDYGVGIETDKAIMKASVLKREPETDLALLKVDGYKPSHTLPLADDDDIILNELIMCLEYGTTLTAGKHINFSPANRIGNVTRFRDLTDLFNNAGDHMLELSFPALKGASGAAIMERKAPFKLWGIVAANVSSELMPAQIETIVDENGKLEEETKFYLPHGLAIHIKHIRKLIESI